MSFPKFQDLKVSLKFLIGGIEGTWKVDESERRAAWELYVELITRVSLARTDPAEGSLRGALSSLYELFEITREILRKYGPDIARPKGEGVLSFGYLAIAILNSVLRPVLGKWHPLLLDHESRKPMNIPAIQYEKVWEHNSELRDELLKMRELLIPYANLLARAADVPPLPLLLT